jgi:serine/threonine-protein kinase
MSPEQAKGKPADKRSDIWAFGAVLYEMLTGSRAFDAEDVPETFVAVLRAEVNWDRLAAAPSRVQTAIRRCLQKDPKQRFGDMQDVRLALEGAFEGMTSEAPRHSSRSEQPLWRRVLPVVSAVILTAAVVGGAGWLVLRPREVQPAPVAQFAIAVSDQVLSGLARQGLAISPDGTKMVFVTENGLLLRSLGDVQARSIIGLTSGDGPILGNSPAFSPDGQWVAFHAQADSSIRRVSVDGGQVQIIAQGVATPTGLSWGEGGILFGQGDRGIYRVPSGGGTPERVASVEAGEVAYGPQVLTGGDALMFTVASDAGADRWDTARIVVHSISSGERRTLITGGSDARYLPSGHVIYAVSGTIYAVAFDAASQTLRGDPVPVLTGVRRSTAGATGASQLAVSNTGSVFFVPGPLTPFATGVGRTPLLVSRGGKPEPMGLPPRGYVRPRVSRDGKRLAVGIEEGADAAVWIYDVAAGSAPRRLTFEGNNRFPTWSPDGRRVAFQSDRDGSRSIYAQASDGGSLAERLTTAAQGVSHVPDSWSPDGRTLLFTEQEAAGVFALKALFVDEKRVEPFGGVRSREPAAAVFSPDGRWVAYGFNDGAGGEVSPNRGIFLQPFPATGATYQVPKTRLDFHPAWSPTGGEIYYVPSVNVEDLMGVSVRTQPSVAFGMPMPVVGVPEPGITSGQPRGYDVLPDGRFLSMMPAETGNAGASSEMRIILNWFDELKRLVPTN